MFDAVRNEFAPKHRKRFDRSVIATAGLLFGFTVCGAVGLATGRGAFALDVPMLALYSSFVPLSVAGFMQHFLDDPPKLPMLATLWFMALFVPTLFFGEVLFGTGTVALGGLSIFLPKLVGFRLMAAAAVAGVVFGAVRADGSASKDLPGRRDASADWDVRHRQAIERLAKTNVAIRSRRDSEEKELAAFEERLQEAALEMTDRETNAKVVLHDAEEMATVYRAA